MEREVANMAEAPQGQSQELKCIIHIGKEKSFEKVKLFSMDLLKNCKEKSLVYKFRVSSEYASISIPESVDNTTGYHSSCCKKFTAVGAKELQLAIEKQSTLGGQSLLRESTFNQTDSGICQLLVYTLSYDVNEYIL